MHGTVWSRESTGGLHDPPTCRVVVNSKSLVSVFKQTQHQHIALKPPKNTLSSIEFIIVVKLLTEQLWKPRRKESKSLTSGPGLSLSSPAFDVEPPQHYIY